jgi:TRAP-type C4-dicarboxylate transport system substrate-binding protein
MQTATFFARLRATALAAALVMTVDAASAQTTLKFATTLPPNNVVVVKAFVPWVEKINAAAGSEFKIELIHGPTIANAVNVWERTATGVVEIGWGVHGAVNLPFPKSMVATLPLLVEEGHLDAGSVALWRLNSSGLAAEEYRDVRPLFLVALPVQGLSSKQPIRKLEDIKGQKVRAADKGAANIISALGASPTSVPAVEVYQALSQGVVTSSIANPIMLGAFRLSEVTKNHIQALPLGAPPGFLVMNKAAYDGLSAKGKQILDRFTGETASREMGAAFEKVALEIRDTIKGQPDQKFTTLPPEERARWVSLLEGMHKTWADSTPDGHKVLAQFKADYGRAKAGK